MGDIKKNRKRKRKGKKKRARFLRGMLITMLTLAAVLLLSFFVSEIMLRVEMQKDARVTLYHEADHTLRLTWPRVERVSMYQVDVFRNKPEETAAHGDLFSGFFLQPECRLPETILQEKNVTIRVNTNREINLFGRRLNWKGRRPFTVTCAVREPVAREVETVFSPQEKTMRVSWQGMDGDGFALFKNTGPDEWELVQQEEQAQSFSATVAFGADNRYDIPKTGESVFFKIRALHREGNIIFCGMPTDVAEVVRDDLLEKQIRVEAVPGETNRFTLTWNETAGAGYELQRLNRRTDKWETLASFAGDAERSYETGYLPAGSEIEMRIVSTGGKKLPGKDYAAEPGNITLETEVHVLYATVWPMKELAVYRNADRTLEFDKVPAGGALCVLGEENDMFRVRANGGEGYIDSTKCMINLAEYVGEQCQYDITNSYACIYRIQGYAMPGITGTAIPGDEHEVLADGTFVVPLLYPVAKDFLKVIEAARADGYRFKIYSAFRPLVATNYLYNTTAGFLHRHLPEQTWERISVDEYVKYGAKPPSEKELPAADEEEAPAGETEAENGEEENRNPEAENTEETAGAETDTYLHAMTNGTYSLNWFFASGANSHNFGTAIDLTIARLDTGEECEMQSPIHELSWLSTLDRNNEHSDRLQKYMKDAGYATLFSEWWHFQVNEAHGKYGVGALNNGISIEGWKKDDTGWRYRLADGTYYTGTTETIGDRQYTFDEAGYAPR